MTIIMDDTQITTLEQVQAVLCSPAGLAFNRAGREELYGWIESVLKRFDYFKLRRKAKGQVKAYLQRLSGISRAQMTRLVTRDLLEGEIKPQQLATLVIHRANGETQDVKVLLRIDTPIEVDYYKHGGILPFVLRQLLAA